MSDRPWMPLYIGDYLADTAELTTEEHGAYLLLIMHYWQTGPLPADDNRLRNICRLSKHKFSKFKPVFSKIFSLQNEKYFHKRLDRELQKVTEISAKRSEAGKKGGQASAEAKNKQKPTQSQSHKEIKEKEAPVGALSVEDQKKEFWDTGVPLLTGQGYDEERARRFLGKVIAKVGPAEALEVMRIAKHSGDAIPYLSKAAIALKLPDDNRELWRIRSDLGLNPEYDDLESCHAEIRTELRKHPDKRELIGGAA